MNLCRNTNNSQYYSKINEIPNSIWEELQCASNIYFDPKYLASLETNNPQITFFYIIIVNNSKTAIAFASIQIIDFHLNGLESSLQKNFEKLKCFGRSIGIFPKLKPIKLLVCGNSFVSGEHGVFIKENENKQQVIKYLANAISQLTSTNSTLSNAISIYLIKDFIKESLEITDELHDLNYYSFNVEPNMVLPINKDWNNFQGYLEAMKTKFRVKAKRALNLSADLTVKEATIENITSFLPEITALYKKVSENAAFNLSEFNLETYKSLKSNFGDKYIVNTYWHQSKIVGFMSGLVNSDSLDAHFVGIDYKLNKKLAIYQRMLYDYVEIGINKKLNLINFGRTASEIKSSIGAEPQDLTCYIRHKKSITNKFIKLFLNYIEPKPFVQKKPFKTKSITK